MATKAYVDAAGGGCYSKCADSGTSAGGATPSCPGGYSSVDTWSERAGFGQYQWGGMNSSSYNGAVYLRHNSQTLYRYLFSNSSSYINTQFVPNATTDNSGAAFNSYGAFVDSDLQGSQFAVGTWNTGYSSGSGNTSYYNDCTACCAD